MRQNGYAAVITGIGVVSPVGIGVEQFWNSIINGVVGVDRSPILVNSDCKWKIAAEVKDFCPEKWLDRKAAKRMDRNSQLGLVGAQLAVEDARLDLTREDPERVGVTMGTAYAGLGFAAAEYETTKLRGVGAISPYAGIAIFTGACAGQISLHFGLKAPSVTISTGCDCSSAAVVNAAQRIISGEADVMLAGGADAPIHPVIVAAFGVSYALSSRNEEPSKASRPFDLKRDGFVMGEGSCILVLEEAERARRRGARIYAEIAGFGMSCDAHHMCHPEPKGEQAVRALRVALAQAGVRPNQIDYLNAHATSTPLGDKTETLVIKKVFGDYAYHLPVSSIKSSLGHIQGACGSSELAACCLAMRDNLIPPTLNLDYPDPDCDLDYVPRVPRHHPVDIAANNSFSFGGRNTAIILKRSPALLANHTLA
jgi:3-oxoacyl-[acyl-carrier-protein] synthase II